MNIVVLIGRLTRDVELSYTPNTQTAVARFTVAVDRPKRNGEEQGADFIDVVSLGRQAENCDRYLSKGSRVAVRGRLETGSYTNREGQKVNTTRVVPDMFNGVEFLGSKGGKAGDQRVSSGEMRDAVKQPAEKEAVCEDAFDAYDDLPVSFQDSDDDIPF